MPRILYGNFGCEHELADPASRPNPILRRLSAELAATLCAIATGNDAIWLPGGAESGFGERLVESGLDAGEFVGRRSEIAPGSELVPWGWSAAAKSFGEDCGLVVHGPPIDAVRRVNARSFRFELEQSIEVALGGSCSVRTPADLATAIDRLPDGQRRWVLKAEFGMSGRERFLGRGTSSMTEVAGWMQRRAAIGGFVFEPWVDRIEEVGLHFTIPATAAGPPRFEGVIPLLVDEAGRYRGSRFEPDERLEFDWGDAIAVGSRVADRLAEIGYFGTLGIDACRYRDARGEVRVRPLQDLNARYTMGRLALGLRQLLQPGESGTWCHVRWPVEGRTWMRDLASQLDSEVRLVRTSPFEIGGTAVAHGTLAVLGPCDAVRRAEEVVFATSCVQKLPGVSEDTG